MLSFDRPVYAIINITTNKLIGPFKYYACYFRGVYDTEKGCRIALGKFKKAMEDFKKAIELNTREDLIKKFYPFPKSYISDKFSIIKLEEF